MPCVPDRLVMLTSDEQSGRPALHQANPKRHTHFHWQCLAPDVFAVAVVLYGHVPKCRKYASPCCDPQCV